MRGVALHFLEIEDQFRLALAHGPDSGPITRSGVVVRPLFPAVAKHGVLLDNLPSVRYTT